MDEYNYGRTNIESTNIESSGTGGDRSLKETFKHGSPDEVKEKVKQTVQKGVAAVAGALKGFADESKKNRMPETTKDAIRQAGDTTRSTVGGVTEEVKNLKEPLKEASHKISDTARDLSQTAKDEAQRTKDAMKGNQGSMGSQGSMNKEFGRSESGRTSGIGGTTLGTGGSRTGQGTEFPDIHDTPLGKSDKELSSGRRDLRE